MINTTYRLTYFDVRGRVDPLRLAFEASKIKYEFVGVKALEWKELKPKYEAITPFGQLPILELVDSDGTVLNTLTQSLAIARYIGSLTKLDCSSVKPYRAHQDPKNLCDEIVEVAQQYLIEIGKLFWDKEFHSKREEQTTNYKKILGQLTTYFKRLRINDNHWVGKQLSLADIYMAYLLEQIPVTFPGIFTAETYPDLYAFYLNFFQIPEINNYVTSERRPQSYTVFMATFGGKPEECVQWLSKD